MPAGALAVQSGVPRQLTASSDQLLQSHEEAGPEHRKLLKAVGEFGGYIRTWIPNYGERYRHGEAISNAFVESAVNQVVSKRMVKKRQIRWTPQGARLLLQVPTRVLNDDLAGVFHRLYSAFRHWSDGQELAG